MKRVISLLLISVLIFGCVVILAGCNEKKSSEYPVTYGDVTITEEPKAIVILNDCVADIVSCIGYDYKMVGRTDKCDQDFLSIVPVVGTADSPDVSAVVAKGADLVIADSTLSNSSRQKLDAAGITVITADRAADSDSLKKLYGDLGAVLGGSVTGRAKGEKAYDDLFELLGQFKTATTGVVKTAAYLYFDVNGQLCTFKKGTFEQKIFGYNGAVNIFSNQEQDAVDTSELRLGSPTCLFCSDESVLDYLLNDESLYRLSALKRSAVCYIPLKDFYRQGSTLEKLVYDMIDYLNGLDKATVDEATPDEEAGYGDHEADITTDGYEDTDVSYDDYYTEDYYSDSY